MSTPPKRRIVILEAAGRLFVHYGPSKTTVADIAREARVGVGSVYLEFRTKKAILGALSDRRHAHVIEAIKTAWRDGSPAAERLVASLDARLEAFLAFAAGGAHARDLFAKSCPGVARVRGSYLDTERALFSTFLAAGRASGELAVDDPESGARALLHAYRSFAPPFLFDHPPEDLRRDIKLVHRLILKGLETR